MSASLLPPPLAPAPRAWTPAERERLADLGLLADPHEPQLRFSVAECDRLAEHGFFLNERVELLNGEVRTISSPNEPHTYGLTRLYRAACQAFGTEYYVRNQGALELAPDTVVVPDLTVVAGPERLLPERPTTALLVVEVSDSTYTLDITVKAELYAGAGIADYWVLDLNARRLLVLRDPAPLPDGGHAYRTQLFRYANEVIAPLAVPTAAIRVADLLP